MSIGIDDVPAKFARIWRGRTTRDNADEYERYWLQNGIQPLKKRGAISVQMLRDDGPQQTEFVTVLYWSSLEAMTGDTGGDPTETHHLDRDPEFLIELPTKVQVLKILASG